MSIREDARASRFGQILACVNYGCTNRAKGEKMGYRFTFRSLVVSAFAAIVMLVALNALSQKLAAAPLSGLPSPASKDTAQIKPHKLQKWNGSLVDAACMTVALRKVPSPGELQFPDPLGQFLRTVESSQHTGQPGTVTPEGHPPAPDPATGSREPDGEPEASERALAEQRAQLKRASMLKQNVKTCAPRGATKHFGLALSDGQELLEFDTAGDFKAKEAIYAWAIEPGNQVKAKVTGVIEENDTIRVALIEIKSKLPSLRVPSGSSSGR